MHEKTDEVSKKKNRKFNQKDASYSVEQTTGMTIGELIDGIRGKIQRSLREEAEQPDKHARK